ncbi:MAG: hypothetical protein ACKN81_10005 [Pirellulaceae bacterium]
MSGGRGMRLAKAGKEKVERGKSEEEVDLQESSACERGDVTRPRHLLVHHGINTTIGEPEKRWLQAESGRNPCFIAIDKLSTDPVSAVRIWSIRFQKEGKTPAVLPFHRFSWQSFPLEHR